jgi:hypothetical protein
MAVGRGFWQRLLTVFLGTCPLIAVQSVAQRSIPAAITQTAIASVAIPASSSPIIEVQAPTPVLPPHAFWDRTNVLLFSGIALLRGLDYASTRNMQARGREEVLLPDDVVNNSAGFASIEVAGTAASVSASYWLHRTGHHKLERWMSLGHIGVTAFGDARNYSLKSRHR